MVIAEQAAQCDVVPDMPLLASNSIQDRSDVTVRGLPDAVIINGRSQRGKMDCIHSQQTKQRWFHYRAPVRQPHLMAEANYPLDKTQPHHCSVTAVDSTGLGNGEARDFTGGT